MTEFRGRPVAYSVWDATRLHKLEASSLAREDIVVDLDDHGGPVPILPAHMPGSPYGAYLSVFPGAVLASIYDRWEARLLESNVRVFLQARGNVNKGIRTTIEDEPQMFFAYNNGITATAEAIETEERDGGTVMTRIRNLQIVNGGQTTASIHAALRAKKDLSGVFVQAKLSIVDAEQAERIVPDISRYANSQNRIAAADFFSNHPFHMRMEDISRRIYAPAREGAFTQSRWFYERARGQFADRRSGLTAAETRKFDLEHPRAQVFTKTDLAKAEMTWRRQPDVVSKGAQKNFAFFRQRGRTRVGEVRHRFQRGVVPRRGRQADRLPPHGADRLRRGRALVHRRLAGEHGVLCNLQARSRLGRGGAGPRPERGLDRARHHARNWPRCWMPAVTSCTGTCSTHRAAPTRPSGRRSGPAGPPPRGSR